MRTVTFKSVVESAFETMGMDPSSELPATTLLAAGRYIDRHARAAWEWTEWPELCDVQEMTPAAGHTIEVSGVIGQVLGIYKDDPRERPDAIRVDFLELGNRVQLLGDYPETVWVRYRLAPSKFSRVEYSPTAAFVAGDVRYDDATGQCYMALQSSQAQPVTNEEYWELQRFPLVLRDAVVLRTAASLQREDQQYDKAGALDRDAQTALLDEQDKFLLKTNARKL